jgi:hypothetical protein
MTERTEQTEQKKQSGLRVAWSTRYLDPDTGRECELQISNGDSRTVLAKSKDVLAWLDQIGAQPVVSGQAASTARATAAAPMMELEDGQERWLITKVKRDAQGRADLYRRGDRYPRTKLFDLGLLIPVGIELDDLPEGVETPTYFYAVVEQSDKLNQAGNPYYDVVRVESA